MESMEAIIMAIRIITDSTSDLSAEWAAANNVILAPLRVTIDGQTYTDGVDLSREDFYRKMAASPTLPKTSQVNPDEFEFLFRKILSEGDDVLGIFISSELSGTCQSALIAARALDSDRVRIVDSRLVTFGLALLVARAVEVTAQGHSLHQTADIIESDKYRVRALALVDTLENLKKGGRLSATSAVVGTLLGVKPILSMVNGRIEAIGKVRGFKRGVQSIIQRYQDMKTDFSHSLVCLGHANRPELIKHLESVLRSHIRLGSSFSVSIGPVVGTYSGEGCVGVALMVE